jgi:hypothetical protein
MNDEPNLSDPVPASRVRYRDDDVWVAVGFPGPVLHGGADVQAHERYRREHGLGPGTYQLILEDDPGPCDVALCSSDGRYHYCAEYGERWCNHDAPGTLPGDVCECGEVIPEREVCAVCGRPLTPAELRVMRADLDFVDHGDHLVRVEPRP